MLSSLGIILICAALGVPSWLLSVHFYYRSGKVCAMMEKIFEVVAKTCAWVGIFSAAAVAFRAGVSLL